MRVIRTESADKPDSPGSLAAEVHNCQFGGALADGVPVSWGGDNEMAPRQFASFAVVESDRCVKPSIC
jgi:hypothetical protein